MNISIVNFVSSIDTAFPFVFAWCLSLAYILFMVSFA